MDEFTYGPLTLDEMVKILSLLENPEEAINIRKALRFYELPERYKNHENYKWWNSKDFAQLLIHYSFPQNKVEFDSLLKLVDGKASLLEIGSSFGGSLKRMAAVMQKGARIVSVDLPLDDTPKFLNPLDSLKDTCRKIGLKGGNVELIVGDSHSKAVVERVREYGPFDFVFIDGDHSYAGMKADWENYGPMGKIVGFHDIGGALPGCRRCWLEIKDSSGYRTEEFIHGIPAPEYGIGIVHRE